MAKEADSRQGQVLSRLKDHAYTLLAPVLVMGIVLFLHRTDNPVLQQVENLTVDWRMQVRAPQDPPAHEDLHIVQIGESDLQDFGRWPWDRRYHATLMYFLSLLPPSAFSMDLLFTEGQDPQVDQAMGDIAAQLGVLTTAAKLDDDERRATAEVQADFGDTGANFDNYGLTRPIPPENISGDTRYLLTGRLPALPIVPLAENSFFGFADSPPALDGKRRHIPMAVRIAPAGGQGEVFPSLVVQTLMLHWGLQPEDVELRLDEGMLIFHLKEGEPRRVPVARDGSLHVNWRNTESFTGYTYGGLLAGLKHYEQTGGWPYDTPRPDNRILLVGHFGEGIQRADLGATPLDKHSALVMTHANAINNILQEDYLHEIPFWPMFIVWLLLGWGSLAVLRRASLGIAVLVPIGILIVFLAFTMFEFLWHDARLYPVVWPVGSFFALHVGVIAMRWKEESDQREQIRSVFSQYVAEGVMNQLLKHPENIDLGGDSRPVSILFSDIRGFTPISESMTEQELVGQLNVYFGAMVECIHRHRGTLHKYIGDAIMAVWGDVEELSDRESAEESTRAALEMIDALEDLNQRWVAEGKLRWNIGLGINFGTVMVGNIGADTRREFTVIGDAVNASSRLEGLTKEFGVQLAVGETVNDLLGPDFLTRPLGLIVVKGKTQAIKVFQVMADRAHPRPGQDLAEIAEWVETYSKAFELYLYRQFREAEGLFAQCHERRPDDICTQTYLETCREFMKNPPGDDWNGVTVMKTK